VTGGGGWPRMVPMFAVTMAASSAAPRAWEKSAAPRAAAPRIEPGAGSGAAERQGCREDPPSFAGEDVKSGWRTLRKSRPTRGAESLHAGRRNPICIQQSLLRIFIKASAIRAALGKVTSTSLSAAAHAARRDGQARLSRWIEVSDMRFAQRAFSRLRPLRKESELHARHR